MKKFLILIPFFLITFFLPNFIAPDWRYFYTENINTVLHSPQAWDPVLNYGLGNESVSTMWIDAYLSFTALFAKSFFSWATVTYLFYLFPVFVLSFVSGFYLGQIFEKRFYSGIVGSIIYSLNTYILLIILGGQFGVALAYSIFPLVFLSFLNILKTGTLKNTLKFSLALSTLMIFDVRISVLLIFVSFIYLIISAFFNGFERKKILHFILAIVITFLVHSFWVFPLLFGGLSSFPSQYFSLGQLKFFSFAFFENSISLLHPNWPENIFGKVYFMKGEFMIIPIFAFCALLFIEKRNKLMLLYFSLIAIIGSFLAKGSNEPFISISNFIYSLPGFGIFRDPTKWYILVAMSYTALIPFSIYRVINRFSISFKTDRVVFIVFSIIWGFLMRDFSTQLKVTERYFHNPPQEYVKLKDFLVEQKNFSRTLWIPEKQFFTYFSYNHPAVSVHEIFNTNDQRKLSNILIKDGVKNTLENYSIKYIIIPDDTEKRIFLTDRKYDEEVRKKYINLLTSIKWLKKINSIGNIQIFELDSFKDRYYTENEKSISWEIKSQTKHLVTVPKSTRTLFFSETYNPKWKLIVNGKTFIPQNHHGINSYNVEGIYGNGTVEFETQKLVNVGMIVSFMTLFGVIYFVLKK